MFRNYDDDEQGLAFLSGNFALHRMNEIEEEDETEDDEGQLYGYAREAHLTIR